MSVSQTEFVRGENIRRYKHELSIMPNVEERAKLPPIVIDCRTSSGESLRFVLHGSGPPLSRLSGNFLYVRGEDAGLEVLYAGETDDLAEHAQDRWAEAEQSFAARAIYTRLNITAAQRRREQAELCSVYAPPMNMSELRRTG